MFKIKNIKEKKSEKNLDKVSILKKKTQDKIKNSMILS